MTANFRRKKIPLTNEVDVDYYNINVLKNYLTETGKIVPSRITGSSTGFQRHLARSIKLARYLGLLPYCDSHR